MFVKKCEALTANMVRGSLRLSAPDGSRSLIYSLTLSSLRMDLRVLLCRPSPRISLVSLRALQEQQELSPAGLSLPSRRRCVVLCSSSWHS